MQGLVRLFAAGIAVSVLPVLASTGAAWQQPGQFRASARTVPVYVTVTGPDGRLVPDLTRDDFEIYDNGELQEITVFSNDEQPIAIVLMLDRSGSMRGNFGIVQQASEMFVRQLLPTDRAQIGSFAFRVQVDPDEFTSDQDELITILKTELQDDGPTPLWNAVSVGMTQLLHEEARRVVLVFTDGEDAPMNSGARTNVSLRDLLKRVGEEDVMVYGVGLAGTGPGSRRGGRGARRGRGGGSARLSDSGLAELAAESGGGYFALDSAQSLEATFARVAEELHHQYSLGFAPPTLDGKVHEIEVRLTQAGMNARARRSYVAPRAR